MFFTDIDWFLSNIGQYVKTAQTAFGVTTVTTVTTTKCLAVTGRTWHQQDGLQFSRVFDFLVFLPSSVSTLIATGDQVRQIKDANSRVVVAAGQIEEIEEFTHPNEGLIYFVAGVSRVSS